MNNSITIEQWWTYAEKSGKAAFQSVDKLAELTGMSVSYLEEWVFPAEVSTLMEWWDTIGKYLYGESASRFARRLGLPPSTMRAWIRGERPPLKNRWAILYAHTYLPCYKQQEPENRPTVEDETRNNLVDTLVKLGEAFLTVLMLVRQKTLSRENREAVAAVLENVGGVSERELEDMKLSEQASVEFGELFS